MSDPAAQQPVEQVDAVDTNDAGGVPFDDDIEGESPPEEVERGGPAYDGGASLLARGIAYPTSTPAGMAALRHYVLGRFDGTDLGILSRPPRVMRGGSNPSLHNWGMAWDWRWAGPGPGRGTADEVIDFCIKNADVLGIQAVHDYAACKYWKSYSGWKNAKNSPSTGFGQPWAQWLHIERTWDHANLATAVDELLTKGGRTVQASAAAAAPAQDSAPSDGGLPDGPMKLGSAGADVGRLQDFLRFFQFGDFTRSDGVFGPRTDAAVRKAQQALADRKLYTNAVDGIWGPKSAAAGRQFVTSLSAT
jgi:peptidoglycan hydrolase-like protein with peptidoglycan-binding domain